MPKTSLKKLIMTKLTDRNMVIIEPLRLDQKRNKPSNPEGMQKDPADKKAGADHRELVELV